MVKIIKNIARGCRCRQSTIDPAMQKNLDGASAAVNVARTGDAAFVTLAEKAPWWEIDLGRIVEAEAIVIYNWDKEGPHAEAGRARCRFLQVWGGSDGTEWVLLHDRRTGQRQVRDFGGILHGPLHVDLNGVPVRYVRLALCSGGILHLNAVQVFAQAEADVDEALLDMFLYANELNLKVARRIFSALDLSPSDLVGHAERLGLALRESAGWFIVNQLMEGGRVMEARQFLADRKQLLGLAKDQGTAALQAGAGEGSDAPQPPLFDRVAQLPVDDPHYWIGALPALRDSSFAWIDRAYRFSSRGAAKEIDRRAPVLYDESPASGRRIFFCGGCEFSYAGYFLRLRGYEIRNTFLDNRSSDPVAQFLGTDGGPLVQFAPDLVILSMEQPFKQLLLKTFTLVEYPRQEQLADLGTLIADFEKAIAVVRRLSPRASLALMSHISYSNRMLHFYEEATFGQMPGDPYTLHDLARAYDLEMSLMARRHGALLLDFEEIVAKFGKSSAHGLENHARAEDYLGGHPELAGARMIANTVDGWMAALCAERPKIKLAVLDLDNTMWDGVFRDDGIEHITRGLRIAHCYAALHLAEQGILLALCSKNDPDTAGQLGDVLAWQFPDLGRKIVAVRVNWLPKSHNIQSIVSELNIGIDSVAFFDDQAFERAEVAAALPQVRVFSDADLLQVGRYAPFLPVSPVSAEGRERAGSYLDEQQRRKEASTYAPSDYGEFLVSCRFELTLRRAGRADAARVAELFQRTNQQNITLRRTGKEFVESVVDDPGWHVWCCDLRDRFGNYGMIGAMLVDIAAGADIVELAFSCRAMGKRLEKAFLQRLAHDYRLQGASELSVSIVRSEKNEGMIEIVQDAGFVQADGDRLRFDFLQAPSPPVHDPWINWISDMSTAPLHAGEDASAPVAGAALPEDTEAPVSLARQA